MFSLLQKFFGKGEPARGDSLQDSAARFETWARKAANLPDASVPELIDAAFSLGAAESDAFLQDAAACLAVAWQQNYGGDWEDSPLLGVCLANPAGIPHGRLRPMALIEKKASAPKQFALADFCAKLPERLEREKELSLPAVKEFHPDTEDPAAEAVRQSESFREFWRERFRSELPLSLLGVREADRFLRTHYFAFFLNEDVLRTAGFFLGEVGRGLFQGEWRFEGSDPVYAALVYPELPYRPVGRIFKSIAEFPDDAPLDEYLRMIPSARRELRDHSPSSE